MYFRYYNIQESFFSHSNQKYCLPLNPKQTPKGFELLCMNTHVINGLVGALGPSVASTLITGLIGGPMLPVFLATMLVFGGGVLTTQADARDFGLWKKGTAEFWPEDDMLKMDVISISDGEVVGTYNQIRDNDKYLRQQLHTMGNHVIIKHGNTYALYAHLSYNSIKIKKGDKVKKGQIIGKVGDTGNSTAPHLHFELTFTNPDIPVGIFKPLIGFEPYKYIPMPWKELSKVEDLGELFGKYSKKPVQVDKSGTLDSLCFLR